MHSSEYWSQDLDWNLSGNIVAAQAAFHGYSNRGVHLRLLESHTVPTTHLPEEHQIFFTSLLLEWLKEYICSWKFCGMFYSTRKCKMIHWFFTALGSWLEWEMSKKGMECIWDLDLKEGVGRGVRQGRVVRSSGYVGWGGWAAGAMMAVSFIFVFMLVYCWELGKPPHSLFPHLSLL